LEEDRVERAIVFEEDPQPFWDGKDRVPVRYIFYYLVVDMFSELYGSFSPAGGTHASSFT
jgi:hypothetical protein